jgi:lipoprotein-anchoring transpeptidase ErfK/SrfK
VVISNRGSYLHALDAQGRVLYHAPSTLGSKYDPSPQERLTVTRVVFYPSFHYNPKLYADVPDSRADANLPPGPNSPVGIVWMALSKPHYGIHGTKAPATIGYADSHGCVRLTNWDARWLAEHTPSGTPVEFLP